MRALVCAAVLLLLGSPAMAQGAYLELLKSDVRAVKMELIKEAMQFSDEEATAFWPVYEKYQRELNKINDATLDLIKDYADHYYEMTDKKAEELIKKSVELDIKRAWLRKKYLRQFNWVLPAKKVAKFYQIENKLGVLVEVQMAAEIPLIE